MITHILQRSVASIASLLLTVYLQCCECAYRLYTVPAVWWEFTWCARELLHELRRWNNMHGRTEQVREFGVPHIVY